MTVYQSPMSIDVKCASCGRVLRGQPCLMPGRYLVRPHYTEPRAPRRTDCPGSRRLDHTPVQRANGMVVTA